MQQGKTIVGFVLGIAATVAGMAAFGAAAPAQPPTVGRFQLRLNENQVFIIDTATGQTWQKYVTAHQGSTASTFPDPKIGTEPLK